MTVTDIDRGFHGDGRCTFLQKDPYLTLYDLDVERTAGTGRQAGSDEHYIIRLDRLVGQPVSVIVPDDPERRSEAGRVVR